MSYILDSIKKSDQERKDVDINAPEQLKTPPYLDVPAPAKKRYTFVYLTLGIIIIGVLFYFLFLYFQRATINTSAVVTPQANELKEPVVAAPPVISREPTVELVEQQNKEVDSLYQLLDQQPVDNTDELAVAQNITQITQESSSQNQTPLVDIETVEPIAEPVIPSIFSFDAATQRSIPDINYGAHIYASDNNSGFVILNGVKKQVGERLRNGIFIEKINEEDLVLSYNGLLFTLPALKSWSYQQ